MRKDMGKIITERPRHGSSNPNIKTRMSIPWKGHDADYEIDKRQSSSRHRIHGYDAKSFTDVLGPLYHYLDKQVGRPWNKVYSELCEFLDKRKVTHAHVFTHIDQHVEKDVYKGVDRRWHSRPYGSDVRGLYVNPKTGLICRQKPLKEAERKKDFDIVKISKENEYRRIDGIWYLVTLKEIEVDDSYFSYITKKMVYRNKKEVREVARKQLNKKELKQLGLENLRCICDNKRFDPECPRHKKKEEDKYGPYRF